MANQGPYQPPDYSANSDDFLQYLSQMGGSQGLGAPSFNPPSDMSPSMSWMGAPQGYPGGQMGEQMGMMPGMGQMDPMGGQPQYDEQGFQFDPQWQDPGYTSFGPEGGQMQQVGGQQQQGPTGHPILDKLMSPDMQDRAMAAAIFARGFVAPQEAINWAMQIRQQRQAQQARLSQAEYEQSQMTERKRMEGDAKTAAKDEKYINQAWVRATNAGVLDDVEQEIGVPWTQWTPDVAAQADTITSRRIDEQKSQQERDKENGVKMKILNDSLKRPTQASLYTDPKSKKYDEEFASQLEAANQQRKDALANKLANDKAMREHRTKMAALAGKLTDDQKTAIKQFDPIINDLVKRRTELNNALTSSFEDQIQFALANDLPAQGDVRGAIQSAIGELDTQLAEVFTGQYQAAGGKGAAPAAPPERAPAPAVTAKEEERRKKLGLK